MPAHTTVTAAPLPSLVSLAAAAAATAAGPLNAAALLLLLCDQQPLIVDVDAQHQGDYDVDGIQAIGGLGADDVCSTAGVAWLWALVL